MPLELLMYNIGLFWGYFAEHTGIVKLPVDLEERYRSKRATEDGRKPHEPRLKKIDELIAEPRRIIEHSYEEGDDFTQVEATDWLLRLDPDLIDEIVEAMNPRTIRKKKPDEWTADDKRYYARKRLMKELTPIARRYGRAFGDHGVKKIKS